jgi:COP9 signalosome complex subunit 1
MGTTSSYLSADALRAAVVEAKQGKDVEMYKQCVKTFYEIHPNDPGAVMDEAWIERVTTEVRLETQRLEKELKGYKNNLIKESIRVRR